MNALQAMREILSCNELIEEIKSLNINTLPDLNAIKTHELLVNYRRLLMDVMENTELLSNHECE